MTVPFSPHTPLERPRVTLAIASSLDGHVSTHEGERHRIVNEEGLSWLYDLRAQHDAIMVGRGTIISDNPDLKVPIQVRQPIRIVADSHLGAPLTAHVIRTAATIPTWFITASDSDPLRQEAFRDAGVIVIPVEKDSTGRPAISSLLKTLFKMGIKRLLVESGPRLAASFLASQCVDYIEWLYGLEVLGGDGTPAIAPLGLTDLSEAPRFIRESARAVGPDLWVTYRGYALE